MRDRSSAGTAEAPAQNADGTYRRTLNAKRNERWCTFQLTLKTITPLMGGGVVAGVPDLLMPLRPRAIKNGIAHWWWLRHRAELKNPDDLWAAHARTFGAASGQAEGQAGSALRIVKVDVVPQTVRVGYCFPYEIQTTQNGLRIKQVARPAEDQAKLAYALFSARGSIDGFTNQAHLTTLARWINARGNGSLLVPPRATLEAARALEMSADVAAAIEKVEARWLLEPGLTATITIAVERTLMADPVAWPRLMTALKLWSSVGGVGARTSRGLGAFTARAVGASPFAVPRRQDEFAALFKKENGSPVLGWRALGEPVGNATDAWLNGVHQLRQFRQARPPPPARPGRSYWPDADVVRVLQGGRFAHAVMHPGAKDDGCGTSRRWLTKLFLGAPVVLSFVRNSGDPETATIAFASEKGADTGGRYPSPVRIRPVEVELDNGATEWQSIFAFLPFKNDVVGKSARVSWTNAGPVPRSVCLPPAQWRPRFKTTGDTHATSPALEVCMGTPALTRLYGARSAMDPVAGQLGSSVNQNWTVIEMLASFLQAGPGYRPL